MKNFKIISLGIAMLISFVAMAQEKTITGIVSDASGPLPGVNVLVKGTTRGVSTDFGGKYSIQAKEGQTLVFSFMGMRDVSKVVGASNVINVFMQDDAKQLSEVVVSASGIKRKKSVQTSSYSKVERKSISHSSSPNIYQGQINGVAVMHDKNQTHQKGTKDAIIKNDDHEDYGVLLENEFESPKQSPLSTFSIDVDNASYTNIRRFINNGQKIPTDAVRVEEMINFSNTIMINQEVSILLP